MKDIIVIGGGFAGAHAAKHLEKHFSVTLIDTKDYFEFTPSVLRTLVEPKHLSSIQVLHKHYLTKTTLIRGEVSTITEKHVICNKKKYSFDYLVIAAGSRYEVPIKEANLLSVSRGKELREYALDLQKAKHVVLVGGGIVGVELAAEIITHYPNKKVTLVHSRDELLNRSPPKVRRYAKRFLERKGVDIIWNEYVTGQKGKIYLTKSGMKIKADMGFLCTGIKPNSECATTLKNGVDQKGCVAVNQFLQVSGFTHIFAAGDITNIIEEKTAQSAQRQGKIVCSNILALESGEKLISYMSQERPMVISLGKYDAMFVKGAFSFTGIIPALLKQVIEWKSMLQYR